MPGQVTTKSLYKQIDDLILQHVKNQKHPRFKEQLQRQIIAPKGSVNNGGVSDIIISEVVTLMQGVLKGAFAAQIVSGLNVTETDPPSNKVIVESGSGFAGGKLFTLTSNVEVIIPFGVDVQLYYVNLFENGVTIDTRKSNERLTLAKIIIPSPGDSTIINNKKVDQDAYIVNQREFKFYGDAYGNLEDDSIDVIRDALKEILADNIIGTIKLNEQLKIENVSGSLSMDSTSLNLKDAASNLLAKFNREGTFFYDEDGDEVAKFGREQARIGNMVLEKNLLRSGDFVSGALGRGFQIKDDGTAEFNDVDVRGRIKSSVFEKDTVSAVGGNLLVRDADILDADMTVLDSSNLVIKGDTTFDYGDIVRIKDGVDDEWILITNVASAPTYSVTRDLAGSYSVDNLPAWKKGTAVVNYGQSGEGVIYMTSSDANAPYIQIGTHAGSPWSGLTTRLRMGNLNGYLGYSSDIYGLGIGDSGGTNANLTFDPTNGIRIRVGTTDKITIDNSGNVTIVGEGGGITNIDGGNIQTNTVTATQIAALTITAAQIAAGTITADKMSVSQLDAMAINTGTLTVDESIQSDDYVADTTGFKLSGTGGLEINTGSILGKSLIASMMIYGSLFAD